MPLRLKKIATEFNIKISTIVEILAEKGYEIGNDPNLVISDDLYNIISAQIELEISLKKESISNQVINDQYKPSNVDEIIKNELINSRNDYFELSEIELIKILKNENEINTLYFEGEYFKSKEWTYGFFKNVFNSDGRVMIYPVLNESINEIFIPNGKLTSGVIYKFKAILADKKRRIEKQNPFLLEASTKGINEIIQLSEIQLDIKTSTEKLNRINDDIEKSDVVFNDKLKENEEKIVAAYNVKEKEAKDLIDALDQELVLTHKEIEIKKNKLTELNQNIIESNNNLIKMESLIKTLKDRVLLCKNLDFISSDDEGKYLNLLTAKEYNPNNHLDFITDFDSSFSELADHIHAYLFHEKNLIYTQYQIRNFLTLLRTNDIIVLSGLSGSGKTQIIKSFAEALGGVVKIIPVKPNWTSSDDLIGYYNPLQMSFLPTPFTEAIVEAIHNPNQLYFICLDEMNLARVEYYFADFLSKLEERNTQPEIELYANHEEELFVSEFSTLLNLVESSINGKEIKSWQEFLNNEEARTKFFEMLGNSDKESMLQLHAKMKRRLIDILKFPSTIKIPANVHFIGAINVDETTHYFSPKILDRVHIVKFDNPLLFEEQVNSYFEYKEIEKELLPVYVHPSLFSERKPFPAVNNQELAYITNILKDINKNFLLPLNIDFGIRSIRQSINYADLNRHSYDDGNAFDISLNSIINQKVLPRFIFDGNEVTNLGKSKSEIANDLCVFLKDNLKNHIVYDGDGAPIDNEGVEYVNNAYNTLTTLINNSIYKGNQFNFFA